MKLAPSFWDTRPRMFFDGNNESGATGATENTGENTGANATEGGNTGTTQQQEAATKKAEAVLNEDGKTVTIDGKTFVVQDHVNHLVGTARTEGKTAAKTELEREAETEAARKAGDFEKLATKLQGELDELKGQLAERDQKDLRARIAAAHKLPADLAALLQGDDEAALTESAKLLAKHIKTRTAPDTEGGEGVGTTSSTSSNSGTRAMRHDDANRKKEPAFTIEGKPKVPWGGVRAAAEAKSA
jgi:hypothetical protein